MGTYLFAYHFWCLFLPLGSYYSIDAIHRYGEEDPKRLGPVVSIASFGLLVQSAAVYLFTALEKRGASWLEGSAVRDALLIDHYQSVFGGWLVQVAPDWILSSANYGVLIFEHLIFFLLFLPIGSFKARVITVSLLWLMHLGFALSLDIGQFPWVCMVSSILFLPSCFWTFIGQWSQSPLVKIASFFVHVQNVLARYLPYYWWMRRQRGAREARILEVGNSLLASGFLVLIALWNLNQIRPNSVYLPRPVERFAHILRIDQRWAMFAPEPMRDDGWFVIVGALRGGASVDLLNRSSTSINWDKPRRVSSLYPDQRWRAYMVMLSREGKSIISRHLVCITVASGIEISVILIPCYDICGYSSTLRGLRVDESFDRSAVWSGNKNVDESFGSFVEFTPIGGTC